MNWWKESKWKSKIRNSVPAHQTQSAWALTKQKFKFALNPQPKYKTLTDCKRLTNWAHKSFRKSKSKRRSRKKRKNKRKRRTSNESISTGKTQKSIAKRRRKSRNTPKDKKTSEGEIVQDRYRNTEKEDIRLQRVILIDFYVYFILNKRKKRKKYWYHFVLKNSSFLFRPDLLLLALLILLLHDKLLGLALKLFGS